MSIQYERSLKAQGLEIQKLQKERNDLRTALLMCRRSDGQGNQINCWCDSEHGNIHGVARPSTKYCDYALAAILDYPQEQP